MPIDFANCLRIAAAIVFLVAGTAFAYTFPWAAERHAGGEISLLKTYAHAGSAFLCTVLCAFFLIATGIPIFAGNGDGLILSSGIYLLVPMQLGKGALRRASEQNRQNEKCGN